MTSHAFRKISAPGEVFEFNMSDTRRLAYHKRPITIREQVDRLKSRGLLVDNEAEASDYLSNISYYRLRAYTYPFQNSDESSSHEFTSRDIHFEVIIDLYCFDRRIRVLIFNAIEKIEVAVRPKIIQVYAESTGDSHWYLNKSLYRFGYEDLMIHIEADVDRSNEDFIKHYKIKYSTPQMPPSWMALEVISFATLSRLYQSLKLDDRKKYIAKEFGLLKVDILENWLHAISNLRNCCAHHSRVWNRRYMVNVKLPYNTRYPFIDRFTISELRTNKLFVLLSCVAYILNIISPGNEFKTNLKRLLNSGGRLLSLKEMGFPKNWQSLPVWR